MDNFDYSEMAAMQIFAEHGMQDLVFEVARVRSYIDCKYILFCKLKGVVSTVGLYPAAVLSTDIFVETVARVGSVVAEWLRALNSNSGVSDQQSVGSNPSPYHLCP